jgi:predicted lipoprotein with Yx(FWY)xxD motif
MASAKTSVDALRPTAIGKVLVAANGRPLYMFTADVRNVSNCYSQCAVFWPPLIATKPSAGMGVHASILGTTKRRDGQLHATHGGHPLYLSIKDTKAATPKAKASCTSEAHDGSSLTRRGGYDGRHAAATRPAPSLAPSTGPRGIEPRVIATELDHGHPGRGALPAAGVHLHPSGIETRPSG